MRAIQEELGQRCLLTSGDLASGVARPGLDAVRLGALDLLGELGPGGDQGSGRGDSTGGRGTGSGFLNHLRATAPRAHSPCALLQRVGEEEAGEHQRRAHHLGGIEPRRATETCP